MPGFEKVDSVSVKGKSSIFPKTSIIESSYVETENQNHYDDQDAPLPPSHHTFGLNKSTRDKTIDFVLPMRLALLSCSGKTKNMFSVKKRTCVSFFQQHAWVTNLQHSKNELQEYRKKGKRLLYSMMPRHIAQMLQQGVLPNSICEVSSFFSFFREIPRKQKLFFPLFIVPQTADCSLCVLD